MKKKNVLYIFLPMPSDYPTTIMWNYIKQERTNLFPRIIVYKLKEQGH